MAEPNNFDFHILVPRRDALLAEEKIQSLRLVAIQNRLSAIVEQLQEVCPHVDTEQTSQYHRGGYDYTSSTTHQLHCKTCKVLLKHWEVNHGTYG